MRALVTGYSYHNRLTAVESEALVRNMFKILNFKNVHIKMKKILNVISAGKRREKYLREIRVSSNLFNVRV
jgi:hypothetical protein